MENSRTQLRLEFSLRFQQIIKVYGYPLYSKNKFNMLGLALQFNMSTSTCRRYIRGQTLPSLVKLIEISNFFEVSPRWLMFGEHSKKLTFMNNAQTSPVILNVIQTVLVKSPSRHFVNKT